ncbi:hypothetical protein [Jeotgalibaca dankookensis]|uniref:hypothetical protein n=1 Tax=Jeotgalibaca dankookensis TaxID=708126 RepID=UPI000780F80E|nr:hypothetical protein [Jeotgalibaca dankookensis]
MATIYSRVTKINNVAGRSDYISNPTRQEFIKLTGKSRDFDWKEYADFEKANQKSQEKNNEARELVIALPNDMSETFSDEILEGFSHDLAKELLGENRDYEFALHFNHSQTNFHMHLLFSERERATTRTPKVYKRDMWFDKTTNRLAKAQAENAELRYKKGDVMTDKEGNTRYEDAPFTKKDKIFTERSWIKVHQAAIQNVLAEYNYVLDVFDSKHEIAQKKLYKGASEDYLEYAQHWNQTARRANKRLHKERATLLEEYKVLKPLMNEYKLFYGKENEMKQADLNLNIYKNNGYSGNHWNIFKRTKYFLMNYEEDRVNVNLYKELRNKIFRSVFNQDDFDTPTHYFEQLVQKIKMFPEKIKKTKDKMVSRYGTVERYKNYKQEHIRKEKEKKHEPKSALDLRLKQLRAKNNQQRKEKKKETPHRNRGVSR